MKKLFLSTFFVFACIMSVFCQSLMPEYTDFAAGLVVKYPWVALLGYALWLLSEYFGKVKWIKANGVLQFIYGLFFKRKQLFGNADLGGNKPPKV